MRSWTLFALLLAACSQEADDDKPSASTDTESPAPAGDTDDTEVPGDTDMTGGDTDVVCDNELVAVTPSDGALDVAIDATIDVIFTADERTTATATLETAGGTSVPLSAPAWQGLGRVVSFGPVDPLDKGVEYVLTVDWSCGTEVVGFTTTDLGDPVDPLDIEDRTWVIDLSTMEVTRPLALGGWLTGLLGSPDGSAAIAALDIDTVADTIDLELGVVTFDGTDWEQDLCTTTLPARDVDFSATPAWEVLAPELPLVFGNFTMTLADVVLGGMFAPGGDFIGEISIEGAFDTRPVSQSLLGNEGLMCGLVGTLSFGALSCTACPGQVLGTSCLDIAIENTRAYPAPPFELVPRTQPDIDADVACAP